MTRSNVALALASQQSSPEGGFRWGANGQKITASQAKAMQQVAAALALKNRAPANLGEGLASLGDALLVNSYRDRAGKAEQEGRSHVAQALLEAQSAGTPEAYMTVVGDEWASPEQRAIAQTYAQRGWAQQDQTTEWHHQDALRADDRAYQGGIRSEDRNWQLQDLASKQEYDAPLRDLQLQQGEIGIKGAEQDLAGGTQLEQDYKRAQIDALKAKPVIPPTDDMREYGVAKGEGFTGTLQDWIAAKPKAEKPPFNVSQASAAGFADRMVQSDAILVDPAISSAQIDQGQQWKNGVPVIGNYLTSTEFKQADQAKRDFINAIMRRESGAVISDSEFANANKQYLPVPGDPPELLQQKAANRRNAIHGVARAAGPSYEIPDTANYLSDPAAVNAGSQGTPEAVPTATNPQTGERVQWNGSEWVPAQ